MKKVFFLSIIAFSALMVSCNKPAQPSEQKDEVVATASPQMAALRTGMDLAKYGYEMQSPSALIEAASILASVPRQDLEAAVEAGPENANEFEKEDHAQITPEKLLADAREWAGDDPTLIAMADRVAEQLANPTRGAGNQYLIGRVSAHSYIIYTIAFRGNELAEIVVNGDHDTDLDLYVYDENGNLIASDTDYTDICYVSFYPRWTGAFYVKVVNRGGVYNQFELATN